MFFSSSERLCVLCTVHSGEFAIHKTFAVRLSISLSRCLRGSVIIVHRQNQFMNGNVCRFFSVFRAKKQCGNKKQGNQRLP
jgi:hypothetical protein